jgi:hypothetical protein
MATDTNYQNLFDPLLDTPDFVLKCYRRAGELLLQGITVMEWGGEGTTAKKEMLVDCEDIRRGARYCLKHMPGHPYGRIINGSRVLRLR